MGSAMDFGTGLGNQYDGFRLSIKEGKDVIKNESLKTHSGDELVRTHRIIGKLRDEEFNAVYNATDVKERACQMYFDD